MWELDYKESWVPKNWCFWTVVLEKTLESPLDCQEIQPVHPIGDQSWEFIGRTDVEAETPILCPRDAASWLEMSKSAIQISKRPEGELILVLKPKAGRRQNLLLSYRLSFLLRPSADWMRFHPIMRVTYFTQFVWVSEWKSLSCVRLFATPLEFSNPESWSGYTFPSPGDLPNPEIKPRFPALQMDLDSLSAEPQGKPYSVYWFEC